MKRFPRLIAYFTGEVGAWYLALFRVLFGGILLAEAQRIASEIDGNSPNDLTELAFLFKYRWFHWLELLPTPQLEIIQTAMVITAVMVAAGLFYRLAILLYGLSYLYFFLVDMSHYNNHYYLLLLFLLFMAVTSPHKVFSADKWIFGFKGDGIGRWQYILFRFQTVWVYFCAGLVKLNADWLQMNTMRFALTKGKDYVDQPFFQHEAVIALYTYGGLLFDLGIGWLLLFRKTRAIGIASLALFHFINAQTLTIGIFPYLMVGVCLLFFEESPSAPAAAPADLAHGRTSFRQSVGVSTLLLFMAIQLVLPGRHHLLPGRVDWTGEGGLFAWRMKAAGRSGHTDRFNIYMFDRTTGEELKPEIALSDRQLKFLLFRPSLFLQVRDRLLEITGRSCENTVIRADIWSSMNGHPYAPLTDPSADLCEEKLYLFRHNKFITKDLD